MQYPKSRRIKFPPAPFVIPSTLFVNLCAAKDLISRPYLDKILSISSHPDCCFTDCHRTAIAVSYVITEGLLRASGVNLQIEINLHCFIVQQRYFILLFLENITPCKISPIFNPSTIIKSLRNAFSLILLYGK